LGLSKSILQDLLFYFEDFGSPRHNGLKGAVTGSCIAYIGLGLCKGILKALLVDAQDLGHSAQYIIGHDSFALARRHTGRAAGAVSS
jgi:hypothetical protein